MAQQLRVQITLLPKAATSRMTAGQEASHTFAVNGRRLRGTLVPAEVLMPGGPAIHADLTIEGEEARSALPPGTQFELWNTGRIGYGTVLAFS